MEGYFAIIQGQNYSLQGYFNHTKWSLHCYMQLSCMVILPTSLGQLAFNAKVTLSIIMVRFTRTLVETIVLLTGL